jgi:N-acetylmuramoyl-L-alanine amidase
MRIIIVDPGHGMSNKRSGQFDPGVVFDGVRECDVALDYANELRKQLLALNYKVVRTRVDHKDPAPVGARAGIARKYKGEIMVSFHVNSTPGAYGTETFYRGAANKARATAINSAVVTALGTRNRGAKTEKESQHASLAIMDFQPCFLIELGFIEHDADRKRMLDPGLREKACAGIVAVLVASF